MLTGSMLALLLALMLPQVVAPTVAPTEARDADAEVAPYAGAFTEAEALVVMEAERTPHRAGWSVSDEYTGDAATAEEAGAPLAFEVEVAEPGAFALWVSARRGRGEAGPILVTRDGEAVAEVDLGDTYVLRWTRAAPLDPEGVTLNGAHRLAFAAPRGYVIDKVVLARDAAYAPQGIGPRETTDAGVRQRAPGFDERVVLPPAWAFGVLYGGYTDQAQSEARVRRLIAEDYPVDAYWVDSWFWDFDEGQGPGGYTDFVGDTTAFPDVEAMWSMFEEEDVKAGIWIWNTILETGNEAAFADFRDRGFCERVVRNTDGWHNEGSDSMTCDIAFEDAEALAYWKSRVKPFFDRGLDFFKLDRSGDVPFSRAGFEASQELGLETEGRGFTLAHLHYTSKEDFLRYPTKWTGDAMIAWTQPDFPRWGVYAMGAYKENVEMVANPRLMTYEIPFLSHDTGGFNYYGSTDQGEELYMRWVQFAAFNAVMHVFSAPGNPTSNMPYRFGPAAQRTFRDYTHLRMRLVPFRYTLAHQTRRTGRKMVQGDPEHPHQFTLGDVFLVAPVVEYGARSRTLHLPEGRWIDYWTGDAYGGGQAVTVDAPVGRLPLLVRAGAIVPMRDYARAVERGSNATLTLDLYPGTEPSSFTLVEDDGLSNAYLDAYTDDGLTGEGVALTAYTMTPTARGLHLGLGATEGTYEGALAERAYVLKLNQAAAPTSVLHDDTALPALTGRDAYDTATAGWWHDAARDVTWVKLAAAPVQQAQTVEVR